jgi:N-acetylglucosamine-6-phosphate deacetylase
VLLIDDAWIICGATPPVPSRLLIAGDRIEAIGTEDTVPIPEGAEVIRVFGRRVTAGFVDMHMAGALGASFLDGRPESFAEICRYAAQRGTTSLLATIESAEPERMLEAVRSLAEFKGVEDGARILGIHLDGPFLNPDYCGHHNPRFFRLPAIDELQRLWEASQGTIKQVTIAPELPGAIAAIQYMRSLGVSVALGNTGADFRTARRAVAHGATVATHIFDTMPPLHHREVSVTTVLLTDDRVTAEIIADGIHIHPAMVRLVLRAKGPERVALVTGSTFAAGLPEGVYMRDEMPIVVEQGVARVGSTGKLAGSCLTMTEAFMNVHQFPGVTLDEAATMTATTPARIMGLDGELGRLEVGLRADITILDHDGSVWMTIVGGRIVYRRE